MRDVAILSYSQTDFVRTEIVHNEVEMLMPILAEARDQAGLEKDEIGFTCSGSTDYVAGQAFAFVGAVDAIGAWPPVAESHVEMDGAWALYEAWVKIQCGEVDSALVFCFGRSSMGDPAQTLILQLDPYTLAPLGPDAISLAALQARALLERGAVSERDLAEVVSRSRRDGLRNPRVHLALDRDPDSLMKEPYLVDPLRLHDCPPISDGAAAMVIGAGDAVKRCPEQPVWIRGIDHRLESHQPGGRDLAVSTSTRLAAERAGVHERPVDVAEIHAPFSHQELILRDALGLSDGTRINPSGGALCANPLMVAGLARLGEAARAIRAGDARRAVAHATSGPCLQQNLVCVLEGE